MTDDLMWHLRKGEVSIKMPDGSVQYVNHVAADRIEKLEAALSEAKDDAIRFGRLMEKCVIALREIADNSGACYYDIDPHVCLRSKIARAALAGEKKDD